MDIDKKLLDYQENRQLEIKIELSTLEPEGLILWQGKVDYSTTNYLSLAIKNGQVYSCITNNINQIKVVFICRIYETHLK